jgi:hypothetical protein
LTVSVPVVGADVDAAVDPELDESIAVGDLSEPEQAATNNVASVSGTQRKCIS